VAVGARPVSIMMTFGAYILIGLVAGAMSGLLGIGGGIVIIPALAYLFGLSQHQAQGTTLALMVPPIGLLAAWTYWRHGYVNVPMAALICLGFFAGGFFGAKLAVTVPDYILKKIFGIALLLISLRMILSK